MGKRTPGPWAWRETLGDLGAASEAAPGATHSVLCVEVRENFDEHGEVEHNYEVWGRDADKALIAAAPELLECLVDAARYICERACNQKRGEHSVACLARTAAIAQARGE